jgi:hypothetical protein
MQLLLTVAIFVSCVPLTGKKVYIVCNVPEDMNNLAARSLSQELMDNITKHFKYVSGSSYLDSIVNHYSQSYSSNQPISFNHFANDSIDYFAIIDVSTKINRITDSLIHNSVAMPIFIGPAVVMDTVHFTTGSIGQHNEIAAHINLSVFNGRNGKLAFSCTDSQETDLDSINCQSCYETIFDKSTDALWDSLKTWKK